MAENKDIGIVPEVVQFYFERLDIKSRNGQIVKKHNPVYYGEKIRLVAFINHATMDAEIDFTLQLWSEPSGVDQLRQTAATFSKQIDDWAMAQRGVSEIAHNIKLKTTIKSTNYDQLYAISNWITIPIDWYQSIEIHENSNANAPQTLCLTARLDSTELNIKEQKLFQKRDNNHKETENELFLILDTPYHRNSEEKQGLLNTMGMKADTLFESIEYRSVFKKDPEIRKIAERFTNNLYNISYDDSSVHSMLQELTQTYSTLLKDKYSSDSFLLNYMLVWLKRYPLFIGQYDKDSQAINPIDTEKYNYYLNYTQEEKSKEFMNSFNQKLYLLELDITGGSGFNDKIEMFTKNKLKAEKRGNIDEANRCQSRILTFEAMKNEKQKEINSFKNKKDDFLKIQSDGFEYINNTIRNISFYILYFS